MESNENNEVPILTTVNSKEQTWFLNHANILDAYHKLLQEYTGTDKAVTLTAIAERCNLSRQTVAKHLDSTELPDVSSSHKLRISKILNAIGDKSEAGDMIAAKLYLQVVWGWGERTLQDINAKIQHEISTVKLIEVKKEIE